MVSHKDQAKHASASSGAPGARNALQLKITLRYLRPPIWRRVLVADTCTMGNLHQLIQRAMGWDGGHLHEFRMPARGFGPPLRTFGHEGEDEDATLLCEVLVRKRQVLLYEYDFGDSWLHEILVAQVVPLDSSKHYPVCLAGARACPPEDCGGVPGYEQLLKALRSPSAPASAELLDWCGDWNPEAFDLESLNRRLRQ